MKNRFSKDKLQTILDDVVDDKKIFGTSFCMLNKKNFWCGQSGNLEIDSQYFIASTTKLYTTAMILILKSQGKLSLDNKISLYLNSKTMSNLHVLKGVDYSNKITIENLLAHTSGLPDYFQKKDQSGVSLEDKLVRGEDQFWSFDFIVEYSKTLQPHFVPNKSGKAHYCDTNYQLLGKIIENITHKSYSQNLQELIVCPLKLTKTYLYSDINDNKPVTLYYKDKLLHIPKAMTSFGADGSIISTSKEMLLFTQAFFSGELFPKIYLTKLYKWNDLFFPLKSGVGLHKLKLPWIFNIFGSTPEIYGHSGLSGALTFYAPKKGIFIAGTVNQIANPSTAYKVLFKLIGNFNEK